ncbi:MAG: hypothetical protein SFU86_18780 [Pirellulaceae bacterium]|nr:hypothetical protein [Pirellulaceae bacterium]
MSASPVCKLLMLALVGAAFCGCNPPSAPPADATGGHEHGDHGHASVGPHRGDLIELGADEYHAEVTHDEATHTVTVYLLDKEAKNAVPIPATELVLNLVIGGQPAQFTLPAAPLETDPAGNSSCYKLSDEMLCDGYCATGTTGRLNVEIAGKTYVGQVAAHRHEGHDHQHP